MQTVVVATGEGWTKVWSGALTQNRAINDLKETINEGVSDGSFEVIDDLLDDTNPHIIVEVLETGDQICFYVVEVHQELDQFMEDIYAELST